MSKKMTIRITGTKSYTFSTKPSRLAWSGKHDGKGEVTITGTRKPWLVFAKEWLAWALWKRWRRHSIVIGGGR